MTQNQDRPAICMGPTGNIQVLIKFMCVETGKKMVMRPPMPDSIIKEVDKLAERDRAENGINLIKQAKRNI